MRITCGSFCLFLILLFFLPPDVESQPTEITNTDSLKYFSSSSFSLVLTGGNNRTFTFALDTEQNFHVAKNRFQFKGQIIQTRSNGEKTSDIYYSNLKYGRDLGSSFYLLGFVRYERNKLAGYRSRIAFSAGAGTKIIEREKVELSSEISWGWNHEINIEKSLEDSQEHTNLSSFFSLVSTNKIIVNLTETAQFIHQETFFWNAGLLKDYRINSFSSISASISSKFALKTSLQIVYQHLPIPGFKNTDFYLLSSVVIKF